MKTLRKIACMALALILILALAMPAFAEAPTTTVTFPGDTGRTFDGYLLLDGSSNDTNFAYTVNEKYKTVLISALGLTNTATSEDIVAVIGQFADKSIEIQKFADKVYKAIAAAKIEPDVNDFAPTAANTNSTTVNQGYWMFVDVTPLTADQVASVVVLDTAGKSALNVSLKPGKITTMKQVDDENDSIMKKTGISNDEDDVTWQDIADYDIGDSVPFRIEVKLPANTAYFPYYAILMQDTVSEGLTFNKDFEVYVRGEKRVIAEAGTNSNADFLYDLSDDEKTVFIYPNYGYNLNKGSVATAGTEYGGDVIPLFDEYKSEADYIKMVGGAEIVVRYTCTLNENAEIGITKGNPNNYTLKFTNSPYDDTFGELKDKVTVLTWQYVVKKVDQDNNALTGADFELYKFIPISTAETMPATQPTNTANLLKISVLNEKDNYYYKHNDINQWGVFEKVARKSKDAEGTVFTFTGLDDGFYYLKETQVPVGYNGMTGNTEFRIWAGHATVLDGTDIFKNSDGLQFRKSPGGKLEGSDNDIDMVTSNIINKTGTELPTTGGMGTTLFYVLGSILVLGAAVLLITNKRMRTDK